MDMADFQKKYNTAVEQIKQTLETDKTVIAAYVYGSANEGNAWVYSDIDITIVVSEDKIEWREITLIQDEFIVNIDMLSRKGFTSTIENRQSEGFLGASIFANSKLLFSKDPIINEYYDEVKSLGKREIKSVLLMIVAGCILPMEKAYKYIYITKEFHRSLPYIIKIVEGIASLVLFANGIRAKKVNIPKASEYEPDLFKIIYYDIINNGLSEQNYIRAIDCIFDYFRKNQEKYFELLIKHIKSENRIFSATEINKNFSFGIHGTSTICEWLVKEKLLNRASSPLKITSKSNVSMDEVSYFA